MNTVIIDISELESPADFHEVLKFKLDLPEFYGRNLDAFHDILTSVPSLHLILCGQDDIYSSMKDYLPRLSAVMNAARNENKGFSFEIK